MKWLVRWSNSIACQTDCSCYFSPALSISTDPILDQRPLLHLGNQSTIIAVAAFNRCFLVFNKIHTMWRFLQHRSGPSRDLQTSDALRTNAFLRRLCNSVFIPDHAFNRASTLLKGEVSSSVQLLNFISVDRQGRRVPASLYTLKYEPNSSSYISLCLLQFGFRGWHYNITTLMQYRFYYLGYLSHEQRTGEPSVLTIWN